GSAAGDPAPQAVAQRALFAARAAQPLGAHQRVVDLAHGGSRASARGARLRNATLTSIAPTGTLSILADCSSGIEPYYALAFVRRALGDVRLPESNARFAAALRARGAWSAELAARVERSGSARGVEGVPEEVQRLFPIAADIAPRAHLAIQAAFQRHVDNAVSKTINLPEQATPAVIREIYAEAWKLGLKGVTVFREGSRGAVLERGGLAEAGECSGRPARCEV
ncbi:MAG TPA: ribonucleotide-diphosphate reductase subunit alpha, partial [Myxococcota bacterium]